LDIENDQTALALAKEKLTGAVVYNINNCAEHGKGIYVWDGTKWRPLDSSSSAFTCGGILVDRRDCEEYFTGSFGTAGCWMTQNLRTHYNMGSHDFQYYAWPPTDGGSPVDSAPINWEEYKHYGMLYNWSAVTTKSICPDGWHLPNDAEWNQLERVITASATDYSISGIADNWIDDWDTSTSDYYGNHGTKMRSQTNIVSTNFTQDGKSKPANTNGFDALLVGYIEIISNEGTQHEYGQSAYFWSSGTTVTDGRYRKLSNGQAGVERSSSTLPKYNPAFSVRCKKD
jgi:uncharacterized protein (TIGR02145 family)